MGQILRFTPVLTSVKEVTSFVLYLEKKSFHCNNFALDKMTHKKNMDSEIYFPRTPFENWVLQTEIPF